MAEFCLDCWSSMMEIKPDAKKYVLTRQLEFCEGCGQYKHVIVRFKHRYCFRLWFQKHFLHKTKK